MFYYFLVWIAKQIAHTAGVYNKKLYGNTSRLSIPIFAPLNLGIVFLSWTSNSSSNTFHIASWKCLESQTLVNKIRKYQDSHTQKSAISYHMYPPHSQNSPQTCSQKDSQTPSRGKSFRIMWCGRAMLYQANRFCVYATPSVAVAPPQCVSEVLRIKSITIQQSKSDCLCSQLLI